MTRQRVLDRAGWTFWWCFAPSLVVRRKDVLQVFYDGLAPAWGRVGD